jgi:dihydroceramidase
MAPITIDNDGVPLLVFEPEAEYRSHNGRVGYWGPVRSSIDWCEYNYAVSFYVAEWFNFFSNALFVALGLWGAWMARRHGLEYRFVLCYLNVAIVGIGSAAFHGTLTHVGQQGDETPMVLSAAQWLLTVWFLDPVYERAQRQHAVSHTTCSCIAAMFCAVFAVVHYVYRFTIGFQLLFAAMLTASFPVYVSHLKRCSSPAVLRLGRTYYVVSIAVALALWLCDQHFCVHLHTLPFGVHNPQWHAWWHGLMGVHTYIGPTFIAYQRLEYLGRRPKIRYAFWGLVPFAAPAPWAE